MVVWTPENESKVSSTNQGQVARQHTDTAQSQLLLAIFQTQKIDKKALLDVCQKEIDPGK